MSKRMRRHKLYYSETIFPELVIERLVNTSLDISPFNKINPDDYEFKSNLSIREMRLIRNITDFVNSIRFDCEYDVGAGRITLVIQNSYDMRRRIHLGIAKYMNFDDDGRAVMVAISWVNVLLDYFSTRIADILKSLGGAQIIDRNTTSHMIDSIFMNILNDIRIHEEQWEAIVRQTIVDIKERDPEFVMNMQINSLRHLLPAIC